MEGYKPETYKQCSAALLLDGQHTVADALVHQTGYKLERPVGLLLPRRNKQYHTDEYTVILDV